MLNASYQGIDRRAFLAAGGLALVRCSATGPSTVLAAEALEDRHGLQVSNVQRVTVRVPYRPVPRRAMDRELPHWRYAEVFRVHLRSGAVGYGETLLYYTWGVSDDDDVNRVEGKNAAAVMWDDTLGAGLQMALFDAVGKSLDVPIHRLLGSQVHDTTPLSWWNIDMPAEDMATECREAHRSGYTAYKTKGRPWFDVWKQVATVAQAVPESFKLDLDFNDTLLDADRAIPILTELERFPQVGIYESPIPQGDVEGNRRIREATRVPIAMHYGRPSPDVVVRQGVCDGFVIGGGVSRVLRQGAMAAEVDMPFWLQLVGTGITAAFSLHLGAVLSHARWPAVNCHQLYEHDLLRDPIRVREGMAHVPDRPGLGHDVDEKALEKYRTKKPKQRPDPARLIETRWPDGRTMYVANSGNVNFMLNPAMEGRMPFFERGVTTRRVPDDGSDRWRAIYKNARQGPYFPDG